MIGAQQKNHRIRLEGDNYGVLRRLVLCRDAWRCQVCGRASQLEIHHIEFRSSLGHDSLENLITLCAACHADRHVNFRQLNADG
jgi:5-methylcytosine-specific restriction endonuclease McrA